MIKLSLGGCAFACAPNLFTAEFCSFSGLQQLVIFIMLYIASLVFIYLKTVSLYLLAAFILFISPHTHTSINHKSDPFSMSVFAYLFVLKYN